LTTPSSFTSASLGEGAAVAEAAWKRTAAINAAAAANRTGRNMNTAL
jgi:hypothetical protein